MLRNQKVVHWGWLKQQISSSASSFYTRFNVQPSRTKFSAIASTLSRASIGSNPSNWFLASKESEVWAEIRRSGGLKRLKKETLKAYQNENASASLLRRISTGRLGSLILGCCPTSYRYTHCGLQKDLRLHLIKRNCMSPTSYCIHVDLIGWGSYLVSQRWFQQQPPSRDDLFLYFESNHSPALAELQNSSSRRNGL